MKNYLFLLLLVAQFAAAQSPVFPLKISENRRYFTDAAGKPFLYQADTGWQLFVELTTDEAVEYMVQRKAQGFTVLQLQLAMFPDSTNQYGHKPFHGEVDFARPNEAWHDHVSKIISKADSLGLLVVMSQPWLGCCLEGFGGSAEKPIRRNGVAKNRQYGQYLGRKFAKHRNLWWIMGGDNDPKADREPLFAFIEGLYEAAPKHQLLTYHASPPHSTTDLFQYAPWVGFSFIYTYWREKSNDWTTGDLMPHVYEAALREWSKSDVIPFVLGESQYEGAGNLKENDMGNPQIIRRQAWWTMLCGGAGHAYGSDIWYFPSSWREILKYPGASQLGHLHRFFAKIPWWTLAPDVRHQAVVAGYGDWSKPNYVTTAVSEDKRLLVSYLPQIQPVVVDFGHLSGERFKVIWYNPSNGREEKVFWMEKKTVQRLGPPNGEDWVLMIQAE